MKKFDPATIATMRSVLEETAQELSASTATRAKMAEMLTRTAAERSASREELREVALEAGRVPAP
jgi:hypothetical protein